MDADGPLTNDEELDAEELVTDTQMVDTVMGLAELSDWCYSHRMSHAIYEGKTYYPCTTTWTDRSDDVPVREWDPNRTCTGYWKCSNGKEDHDDDAPSAGESQDSDDDNPDAPENPRRFKPLVIPDDPDRIIYVFNAHAPLLFKGKPKIELKHHLVIKNMMGKNSDHRGSNHSNLKLDFHLAWEFPPGIYDTYTILAGFWRIKANKYDNQYEAFFPFRYNWYDKEPLDPEEVTKIGKQVYIQGGQARIKPIIDHGS
jgi:hypothetical protein